MGSVRARGNGSRKRRRYVPWLVAAAVMITASAVFAAPLSLSSQNLTVYRTCYLTPSTTTDTVEIDSWVNQSSGTQNNGGATTLTVQSATGSKNDRTYIRFDLSLCSPALPSSSSAVKQATLRLYATALVYACRTYDIYRVTATWGESTITWNNQPSSSASATSQMTIGTPCAQNTTTGYVSGWDLTADVQSFVSGASTNYGWMIRDNVEPDSPNRTMTFVSKENTTTNPSGDPQLIITYQT